MESSEGSSNGSARRIESQLTHDGEGMTRPPTQATSAPSIIGGVGKVHVVHVSYLRDP